MERTPKKRRREWDSFTVFSYVFVTLFMVAIIIPFWNVFTISITSATEYINTPILLFPKNPTFSAFQTMLQDKRIVIGYSTTLKILVMGLPLNVLLTVMISYALSRKSFPGKKFFVYFIMFTMFFSGGIIPLYLLVKELGLNDSLWAVVLPSAVNTFNMIITRNYFQSLPQALEESAQIDGAGNLTILFRIYLPLARPILATITLFYAVDRWNEWYSAMIFIRNPNLTPLQLVLRSIVIESSLAMNSASASMGAEMGQEKFALGTKMAAVFVSMLPIMVVYPFLQKYFVKGVLIGSIKA